MLYRTKRFLKNPSKPVHYAQLQGNESTITRAAQLHGAALSFNNYLDLDAAVDAVCSTGGCAAVIVKHGNPCGVALAETPAEAFRRARKEIERSAGDA